MTDAGKYLGRFRVSIRKYILNNIPFKGYTISKALTKDKEIEILSTFNYIRQQPVLLTKKETGFFKEFSSMTDAAKYLGISRARL